MVYVVAGTGVGSGIVLNGRLLKARFSLGEIGHTIIDRATGRTVEQLASGSAIRRSMQLDVSELAARASRGDPEAVKIFNRLCDDLAIGRLQPRPLLLPRNRRSRRRRHRPPPANPYSNPSATSSPNPAPTPSPPAVRVVKAQTGDDVGLLGAAAYWSETHP